MAARLSFHPQLHSSSCKILNTHHLNLQPHISILHFPLRRISASSVQASSFKGGKRFVGHSRFRIRSSRNVMGFGEYDDVDEDDDDDEDEDDEDRSLDLLVKFVQNVFRKVSRKARKAVRSVLPVAISRELVGFSVNGFIILTFLWVLKALLEVICTIGSFLFVSILLIRGIWMGISYLQDSRNYRIDSDEYRPWSGTQPAS